MAVLTEPGVVARVACWLLAVTRRQGKEEPGDICASPGMCAQLYAPRRYTHDPSIPFCARPQHRVAHLTSQGRPRRRLHIGPRGRVLLA